MSYTWPRCIRPCYRSHSTRAGQWTRVYTCPRAHSWYLRIYWSDHTDQSQCLPRYSAQSHWLPEKSFVFIQEYHHFVSWHTEGCGSKLLIYSGSFKRAIIIEDYAGLCFVCLCKCSGDYLWILRWARVTWHQVQITRCNGDQLSEKTLHYNPLTIPSVCRLYWAPQDTPSDLAHRASPRQGGRMVLQWIINLKFSKDQTSSSPCWVVIFKQYSQQITELRAHFLFPFLNSVADFNFI